MGSPNFKSRSAMDVQEYCSVFGGLDTQFGMLVGFISIFTSRNYT
jgi:hypothetical protein